MTTSPEIVLPPLPIGDIDVYFNGQRTDPAFTAEQVQAFARTAVLAGRASVADRGVRAVPGEPVASEQIKRIADAFAGQNGWDGVDGAPAWLIELVQDVADRLAASVAVPGEPVAWVNRATLISAKIAKERGGTNEQHTWCESKTSFHDTPLYERSSHTPDNPPRLRRDGESLIDYRTAMGWGAPRAASVAVPGEPIDLGPVYVPDDQGPEDVRYVREDRALAAIASAASVAVPGEPVAPPDGHLHDDGYFTWAPGKRPPFDSHYAGWHVPFYLAASVASSAAPASPSVAQAEPAGEAKPELAYSSTDDGRFSDDWSSLIDSLLCDHEQLAAGLVYYVGEKREWKPSDFVRGAADSIIDDMRDQAWQEADEWSEDFAASAPDGAKAELDAVIGAWADRHFRCDFFTVEKVREVALTEEEAADANGTATLPSTPKAEGEGKQS